MKRALTDSSSREPKRLRFASTPESEDPFSTAQEKDINELHTTDGSGHLLCKVLMIWPPSDKLRLVGSSIRGKSGTRFDVEISGRCRAHFGKLTLHVGDEIRLSLRDAELEALGSSSRPGYAPFKIKFTNGVVFKFDKRPRKPEDVGRVVDIWKVIEEESNVEDNKEASSSGAAGVKALLGPARTSLLPSPRLSSPGLPALIMKNKRPETPPKVSSNTMSAPSHISPKPSSATHSSRPEPVPSVPSIQLENTTENPPGVVGNPSNAESTTEVPPSGALVPVNGQKMSNRALKRLKKQQRKGRAAGQPVIESENQNSAQTTGAEVGKSNESVREPAPPVPEPRHEDQVVLKGNENDPDQVEVRPDTKEKPQWGFVSDTGETYSALDSLEARTRENMVGVVTSIGDYKETSTKDLCVSLTIADPSIYGVEKSGTFRINCFTGKHKQWLPHAKYGEVLILRSVSIMKRETAETWGLGYKDRLQWATYDPATGRTHHGDKASAPESESLNEGYGYTFSPFWTPGEIELGYCLKIADWWRTTQAARESSTVVGYSPDKKRVHRLLCDTTPTQFPNGFFDCTVEVIHCAEYDERYYQVYVTDYTKAPEGSYPIQGSFCPTSLADKVLLIEFWQEARDFATKLKAGEYLHIGNARVKVSNGGYIEGTFSEGRKARKLTEADASPGSHLESLLKRKKEWEDSVGPGVLELKLIGDVVADNFYDCVVEVLHVEPKLKELAIVYVTDYSVNEDLPDFSGEYPWGRKLKNRALKVTLLQGQAAMTEVLRPGSFFVFRSLRMKKGVPEKKWQGRQGGSERLIHQLRTRDPKKAELVALLERKKQWETELEASTSSLDREGCQTIKEILGSERCPNSFEIVARVKDFWPLRFEDCVVVDCDECKNGIPRNMKACPDCDGMERSRVRYRYLLYFRLKDENDDELEVAITDGANSILSGVVPGDLRDDRHALDEFKTCLEPYIGNLIEVHESTLTGERMGVVTPEIRFRIDSWNSVRGSGRSYGLVSARTS